jgi:hypothetical protein
MGEIMKILSLLLLALMSSSLMAQSGACFVRTSTTQMDRYDIERLLQTQKFTICVDSNKFDRWDLEQLMKNGGALKVYVDTATSFDRWDLEQLSKNGKLSVVVDTSKRNPFDRWDLEQILNTGAKVAIKARGNTFDRWDLEQLLKKGAWVLLRSSLRTFDRWDYEQLGKASQQGTENSKVTLFVESGQFDSYDIQKLMEAGVHVVNRRRP